MFCAYRPVLFIFTTTAHPFLFMLFLEMPFSSRVYSSCASGTAIKGVHGPVTAFSEPVNHGCKTVPKPINRALFFIVLVSFSKCDGQFHSEFVHETISLEYVNWSMCVLNHANKHIIVNHLIVSHSDKHGFGVVLNRFAICNCFFIVRTVSPLVNRRTVKSLCISTVQ